MIIIHELGIRSLSEKSQRKSDRWFDLQSNGTVEDPIGLKCDMSVLRRVWKHDLLHFDGTTKTIQN